MVRHSYLICKQMNLGIIGTDDLKEEGCIAHILGVNAEEGDEITEYFNEVIH